MSDRRGQRRKRQHRRPVFVVELGRAGPWRSRPLNEVYPIVYIDAIRVRAGTAPPCESKPAPGRRRRLEGRKRVLGTWFEQT